MDNKLWVVGGASLAAGVTAFITALSQQDAQHPMTTLFQVSAILSVIGIVLGTIAWSSDVAAKWDEERLQFREGLVPFFRILDKYGGEWRNLPPRWPGRQPASEFEDRMSAIMAQVFEDEIDGAALDDARRKLIDIAEQWGRRWRGTRFGAFLDKRWAEWELPFVVLAYAENAKAASEKRVSTLSFSGLARIRERYTLSRHHLPHAQAARLKGKTGVDVTLVAVTNLGGPAQFRARVNVVDSNVSSVRGRQYDLWWERSQSWAVELMKGQQDDLSIGTTPWIRGWALHGREHGWNVDYPVYFPRAEYVYEDNPWALLDITVMSNPAFLGSPVTQRYRYDDRGLNALPQ